MAFYPQSQPYEIDASINLSSQIWNLRVNTVKQIIKSLLRSKCRAVVAVGYCYAIIRASPLNKGIAEGVFH